MPEVADYSKTVQNSEAAAAAGTVVCGRLNPGEATTARHAPKTRINPQ